MKKLLALAVISFIGLTGVAHAATLDIFLNAGAGGSFFGISSSSLSPNPLNVDINLAAANGTSLNLGPNSFIVNGSNFAHKDPSSNLTGAGNAGNYVAVEGGGQASFSIASGNNAFGFSWGTIDTYNQLILTDVKGNIYTINGTQLAAAVGTPANGVTNFDVDFIDPNGSLKTAVFTSTINSFEFGNLAEGNTAPLPASLPLFGAALIGLVVLARRRAKSESV